MLGDHVRHVPMNEQIEKLKVLPCIALREPDFSPVGMLKKAASPAAK